MQPFVPTARQLNVLLIAGFLSVGYALYLRYLVVEPSIVGLACDGGLKTWLCATRRIMMILFNNSAFGFTALGFAILHFWRPSMSLIVPALVATGFGLVLYNTGLSALAAALLIVAFARRTRTAG